MAVELLLGSFMVGSGDNSAVQEAAASGLKNVEKLLRMMSPQEGSNQSSLSSSRSVDLDADCKITADAAVSKFKRVISLLGCTRTGHARFRRAPISSEIESPVFNYSNQFIPEEKPMEVATTPFYATPLQQIPLSGSKGSLRTIDFSCSGSSALLSTVTMETEEMKEQQISPTSETTPFKVQSLPHVSSSSGKPPLSSSSSFSKRKCTSETIGSGKCNSVPSGRCHCSKKRKLKQRRVIRVPAISMKLSDIPPDDYSWRKYGQKPIKGSPHPRGYYKCSTVRGCPARKHVEIAHDDPTMLVVTYEGDHNHTLSAADSGDANIILESS